MKFSGKEYSYFDALAFSREFHETLKLRYCQDWRHFLWKRYSIKIRILLQERFYPIVHHMKSWWNRFGWAVLYYKNEEKKKHENHENHEICTYSVTHMSIHPSKGLCSKMAPGEVGLSLPWWCHNLFLLPPGYWGLFLNLIIFSCWKNVQFQRNFRLNLKVLNFSNFTLWNFTVQIWPKIPLKLCIFPTWKNYEV